MASSYPKLPGFNPTQDDYFDIQNFKRFSASQQDKNRDIKNVENTKYPLPRQPAVKAIDQSRAFHPNYLSTTHDTYTPKNSEEITTLFQPDYVLMDRHVLRFYGFFKESAVESPLETYRVRKVIIYFYLEDNSISLIEPKQMNSGIPQGAFLKRQKVQKSDGSGYHLTVQDFQIGQEILIFGKNIRIFDCDEYTREFYENIGINQNPKQECQTDNWETKTLKKYIPQKDTMMKDFLEHKLGGGRVTSQKQFLENDRKVLKFFVFSENPYILHYYLADDTLEIREVNYSNSGRDPYPLMLKRQKLPKKFSLNQPGQVYMEDFITPLDIKFGEALTIFGKKFQVNGCDLFTHKYYKEKYNKEFPLGNIDKIKAKEQSNILIPPYNGFGDEEDSLGNVYRLNPQPPKKDYFKWVDNQIQLRMRAKLNTDKPEDINRRFIITYYLNDDSLLVYELFSRNSGIQEGKFLERKRYKNPARNSNIFQPEDLLVDSNVKINGFSFNIYECDEFSRKWYVNNLFCEK